MYLRPVLAALAVACLTTIAQADSDDYEYSEPDVLIIGWYQEACLETIEADTAGNACGWTGACPEPGCEDRCVPAFDSFPYGANITFPAKAMNTLECPAIALLVKLFTPNDDDSSRRKLQSEDLADLMGGLSTLTPLHPGSRSVPGVPLMSPHARKLAQQAASGAGELACPDEAQVAVVAPTLAKLAALHKADGVEGMFVPAFEDEAALNDFIATSCATEETTGELAVFYGQLLGLHDPETDSPADLPSLTLCTNADGVGTEWLAGRTTYEETCEASFDASALDDIQCLHDPDLLHADCADAWGSWLGLNPTDVATLSATSQAIYEGCTAITTKEECLSHTMAEADQHGIDFVAALESTYATTPTTFFNPQSTTTGSSPFGAPMGAPLGSEAGAVDGPNGADGDIDGTPSLGFTPAPSPTEGSSAAAPTSDAETSGTVDATESADSSSARSQDAEAPASVGNVASVGVGLRASAAAVAAAAVAMLA